MAICNLPILFCVWPIRFPTTTPNDVKYYFDLIKIDKLKHPFNLSSIHIRRPWLTSSNVSGQYMWREMSRGMTKPNSFVYRETIIPSSIWSDQLRDMELCQSRSLIISFTPLLSQYKSKTPFRLMSTPWPRISSST